MRAEQIKTNIKEALQSFAKGNLTEKSLELFEEPGYVTSRRTHLYKSTYAEFKDTYGEIEENRTIRKFRIVQTEVNRSSNN